MNMSMNMSTNTQYIHRTDTWLSHIFFGNIRTLGKHKSLRFFEKF